MTGGMSISKKQILNLSAFNLTYYPNLMSIIKDPENNRIIVNKLRVTRGASWNDGPRSVRNNKNFTHPSTSCYRQRTTLKKNPCHPR